MAERDPKLPEKLKSEWPAILRWCVNGCLAWQQAGLAPPAAVLDATTGYFSDQDTLQQWLDDCTHDAGPNAFTRVRDLFNSWQSWCEDRNHKPGSATALSEALADRGFERGREGGTGQRGFARLAIKPRQ
jgi:putative DNA primase/helicase